MDIGTRLDKAMKDAKVASQSQLARASGVPQGTISRILKGVGTQGPETATLDALAKALSVELRWLQQGIGPQRQERTAESTDPGKGSAKLVQVVANEPPPKLQWVTEAEATLLSIFRSCEKDVQQSLIGMASGLIKGSVEGKPKLGRRSPREGSS